MRYRKARSGAYIILVKSDSSSYSFPALNAATLDNVSDSVLIHFLELLSAPSIEFFVLKLQGLQLGLCEIAMSQLKRKLFLLL